MGKKLFELTQNLFSNKFQILVRNLVSRFLKVWIR